MKIQDTHEDQVVEGESMTQIVIFVLVFVIAAFVLLVFADRVFATQDNKVYWCHCAESGICNTLHLPPQALKNAGHVSANGNPLHAGDHAGACVTPTNTPTLYPTVTPIDTNPTPTINPCDGECITPTPTVEVTPTPTEDVTPTPTRVPVVTPTPINEPLTPTQGNSGTGVTANSCPDLTPVRVTDIWVERGVVNDGKLEVHWGTNPNYGKAHIKYSEVDGQWRYALLNTDNDGVEEIGELKNGVHYFFSVAYVNGCAVGAYSPSFDPLP